MPFGLPGRRPVTTPRACGARKKTRSRSLRSVRKRLIHKIRQRAAHVAVYQPHDFVEIGNFAPFSEYVHIKGRHFPDFFPFKST